MAVSSPSSRNSEGLTITIGVVFFLVGVLVGASGITAAVIIRQKAKGQESSKEPHIIIEPNQVYELEMTLTRNPGAAVMEDPVYATVSAC